MTIQISISKVILTRSGRPGEGGESEKGGGREGGGDGGRDLGGATATLTVWHPSGIGRRICEGGNG